MRCSHKVEVVYYWYDHLLLRSNGDADIVEKAIREKDFDTFMRIKKKYEDLHPGITYFPNIAIVIDPSSNYLGDIDITRDPNFKKITRSEYECG